MNRRVIDMSADPRRAHFDYFRSLANNQAGVTVDVDVTRLVRWCKARGASLYLGFMHAAALAANAVPELRRRIVDGGTVVEYDGCGTSHVEMTASGAYGYCTLWHDLDWDEFFPYAEAERAKCRESASIDEDDDVDALYFVTCLPWLHYRELIQPTEGGDASNPRISWGRDEADWRGRLMMPVTLLCHHALADGIHIARFYENLNRVLADLPEE